MKSDSDFIRLHGEAEEQPSKEGRGRRRYAESRDLKEIKKFFRDGLHFLLKVAVPVAPLAVQHVVLPPPALEELEWIAIFLCLVGSTTVFLYRDRIGYALDERVSWLRLAPVISVVVALAATQATVFYLLREPARDLLQGSLYVLLWPAYAVPLTVIFVCLEHQRKNWKRIEPVLSQLAPVFKDVLQSLQDIARFLSRSRENSAWREFGYQILEESRAAFRNITRGRIVMDVIHMPKAFTKLADKHCRFDAISVREIAFWGPRGDGFAHEYYKCCAELVCKGKIATRIFVVSQEEFEQFPELLYQILLGHIRDGIGVAVVPYEELPDALRQRGDNELDFALWNLVEAWSSFRQNEGASNRNIVIGFWTGDVGEKLGIYEMILQHAWLVDNKFREAHQSLIARLVPVIRERNKRLYRRLGGEMTIDGDFFVEIGDSEKEVKSKVEKLIALWKGNQAREESAPVASPAEGKEVNPMFVPGRP
jgi:hypothetical protein